MANIKLGAAIADIRGSIGGTTFSHGKGGSIARSWKKPVNPRAPKQIARRASMGSNASIWNSAAMATYRAGWNDWATSSPGTNKLGEAIVLTGYQAFCAINSFREAIGLARTLSAPTAYGSAKAITLTASRDTSANEISIVTLSNDADLGDSGLYWAFFELKPQSPGNASFPTAGRYLGKITGTAPAPTLPQVFTPQWAAPTGARQAIRAVFMDAAGRISPDALAAYIIAA